jgi:bestrophin, other
LEKFHVANYENWKCLKKFNLHFTNPFQSFQDQEDNASGIHFSASGRRRNQSGSSTASMQSIAGQITRVNTVTSLLKRFLSKEDSSRPSSATKDNPETGARLGTSVSSASISGGKYPTQIGSMKISDQVIEEVDEQMTITSLRNRDDPRPTAQSLFGQSPPTDPITIPNATPAYNRFVSEPVENLTEETSFFPPGGVEDLLSTSAPASKMPTTSSAAVGLTKDPQFGSQDSGEMAEEELDSTQFPPDDFERLRQEREQAKIARQKEKLARSISTQQGLVQQIEMQEILTEALTKPQSTSGTSSPTAEAS